MRIGWGEDYAVIFTDTLAKNYQKKLVSLSTVSKENRISIAFLKQLAVSLKKNGLIISKEGVTGGYRLAKAPSQISLMDVVSSVNKNRGLTTCCHEVLGEKPCPRENFCRTKNAWVSINQEFNNKLKSVTLADL